MEETNADPCGSRSELEEGCSAHTDTVRRRLERLGARRADRALDVDDLLQDSLAALYSSPQAQQLPSGGPLRALLLTIATNKLRDRRRAEGRQRGSEPPLEDESAAATEGSPRFEDWAQLCACVGLLADASRRTLVMRAGLGVPWEAVGFVEQREGSAIRSLFYRSRRGLADRHGAVSES